MVRSKFDPASIPTMISPLDYVYRVMFNPVVKNGKVERATWLQHFEDA